MIEQDIYTHLKNDATLQTLLSGSATDSKMYPIQATQGATAPFIVFEPNSPPLAYTDIVETDEIQFNIFSETYLEAHNIEVQIKKLLSISDELMIGASTSISSSTYYIYSGIVSGSDAYRDDETELYIRTTTFSFLYKRKV